MHHFYSLLHLPKTYGLVTATNLLAYVTIVDGTADYGRRLEEGNIARYPDWP